MHKWFVELYVGEDILHIGEPFVRKDVQTVLTFLSTRLQNDFFRILIIGNYHFWVSNDLDTFDNEDEAYQYAQNQLPILNGIMQIKFDRNIYSIKIGDIYHLENNNRLTRTKMRSTVTVLPSITEELLTSSDAQNPSTLNVLLTAYKTPLVAEALQQFATSHNWYSLVKVFEIISAYMGKAEANGKLPRGTFDKWTQGKDFGKNPPGKSFDFLQTAHSYHWSGIHARHSSVGSQKRTNVTPMDLRDAIEYITHVFLKWLETNPE